MISKANLDIIEEVNIILLNYNLILGTSYHSISDVRREHKNYFSRGRDLGSPIPADEIFFSYQRQRKSSLRNQRSANQTSPGSLKSPTHLKKPSESCFP